MYSIIKYLIPCLLFIMSGCETLFPDLERNNPSDVRDGQPRLTLAEVQVLDGSGRLTTAKPNTTVFISVTVLYHGDTKTKATVKNLKGVFTPIHNQQYVLNPVPVFGTSVAFYKDVPNRETEFSVGQRAYAVAFTQNYGTYAFQMDISENARKGDEIMFSVELKDDSQRAWNEELKIIVD